MRKFTILLLLSLSCCLHATTLKTLDGNSIDFDSLRGKWVFINYWASWCNPCLDEITELNHFYASHKDNIALFAVNYDGQSIRDQRYIAQKLALQYPSLANDPSSQLRLGDIRGVPATFVFNPQGKLSDVLYGAQTQASLNQAMQTNH